MTTISPCSPLELKQYLHPGEEVVCIGEAKEQLGNVIRERWVAMTDEPRLLVLNKSQLRRRGSMISPNTRTSFRKSFSMERPTRRPSTTPPPTPPLGHSIQGVKEHYVSPTVRRKSFVVLQMVVLIHVGCRNAQGGSIGGHYKRERHIGGVAQNGTTSSIANG